jgi:hypothetical protein
MEDILFILHWDQKYKLRFNSVPTTHDVIILSKKTSTINYITAKISLFFFLLFKHETCFYWSALNNR